MFEPTALKIIHKREEVENLKDLKNISSWAAMYILDM